MWDGHKEVAVSGYFDDLITDRAMEFVGHRREHPFFLEIAYIASHFNIERRPKRSTSTGASSTKPTPARPILASYAAMVARLDWNIGRLLARLEERGQAANTLIVFTSDNGATFEKGNAGASSALDSNRPFRGQRTHALGGGHPGTRTRQVAGQDHRGDRLHREHPPDRSHADLSRGRRIIRRSRVARRWSQRLAHPPAPGAGAGSHIVLGMADRGLRPACGHAGRLQTGRHCAAENPSFTTSFPIRRNAGTLRPVVLNLPGS